MLNSSGVRFVRGGSGFPLGRRVSPFRNSSKNGCAHALSPLSVRRLPIHKLPLNGRQVRTWRGVNLPAGLYSSNFETRSIASDGVSSRNTRDLNDNRGVAVHEHKEAALH